MNANERRIRTLEQAIPKPHRGFTATLSEADPELLPNDPRLRRGVEEFVYVFPAGTMDPGRRDKRGRGWLSPWTVVEFWGGGKRSSWNKALAMMRADKELNTELEGCVRNGWIEFDEEGGNVRRADTLSVIFLGWSKSWCQRYQEIYKPEPHEGINLPSFQNERRPQAEPLVLPGEWKRGKFNFDDL